LSITFEKDWNDTWSLSKAKRARITMNLIDYYSNIFNYDNLFKWER